MTPPVTRLALKELRETLRDRRTLITLLLMPILLYPLMGVGFRQLFVSAAANAAPDYFLAAPDRSTALRLANELQRGGAQLVREDDEDWLRVEPPDGEKEPPVRLGLILPNNPEAALASGQVHVILSAAPDGAGTTAWTLHVREGSVWGSEAVAIVRRLFQNASVRLLAQAADRPVPITTKIVTVANRIGRPSNALATLVPLVLVLMTVTGAVYPAIDLTAGERERGTLEVLMAAPVSRVRLLAAKYVAVVCVALITGAVNLLMMGLTLSASGLGSVVFGTQGPTWTVVVSVVALLALFTLFFAAVLLAVTSFARSFKEAQAYIIPIMLLSLAPGMAVLLPGVQLSSELAAVPLMNVVLLAREVVEGTATAGLTGVVVVTTLFYAAAAIAIAARLFGAEAVLYGDGGSSAELWRRPTTPSDHPRPATALLVLALVFPVQFLLVGLLAGALTEADVLVRVMAAGGAGALVFAGLPIVAAWLGHVRASAFAFGGAPVGALVAALLLGLSLGPLAGGLTIWLRQLGILGLSDDMLAQFRRLAGEWAAVPWPVVVIAIGLLPALAEELFFRGYLFGALGKVMRPGAVIAVTALAFGLCHLLMGGLLTPERAITSGLAGLVLGWVRWRTGSIWPGVVLHAVNNTTLALVARLAIDGGAAVDMPAPPLWIWATLTGVACAAAFGLWWTTQPILLRRTPEN